MPRFLRSLFGQVLLALVVGVLLGLFVPEFATRLKPLGDGFIKLIKMIFRCWCSVSSCTALPAPAT